MKGWDKKKLFLLIANLYLAIYLIWRVFVTLPDKNVYGWIAFAAGVIMLVAEGLSILEALSHCAVDKQYEIPKLPESESEKYPHVDVFIATHNEETDLLYKTVNGCCAMEYPDPTKVYIYLCDDTERESVRELARQMGVGYLGVTNNKQAKAGNLNYAISQTSSPLIVTFDADMIPNSNFLMETVPYFSFREKRLALSRRLRAFTIRICSNTTFSVKAGFPMSRIIFSGG